MGRLKKYRDDIGAGVYVRIGAVRLSAGSLRSYQSHAGYFPLILRSAAESDDLCVSSGAKRDHRGALFMLEAAAVLQTGESMNPWDSVQKKLFCLSSISFSGFEHLSRELAAMRLGWPQTCVCVHSHFRSDRQVP